MFAFGALRLTFGLSARLSPRLAGRMAAHLFHKPPRQVPLSDEERILAEKADDILAEGERCEMEIEGETIVTWRLEAEGVSRGTVVLVHGWTGAARFMVGFAAELVAAGYDALLMDLPAHGVSTGKSTDVAACGRALEAILLDTGPVVGLVGHSFAGGVISLALKNPDVAELAKDARIALVASPNQFSYVTRQFASFIGLSPAAKAVFEGYATDRIGLSMAEAQGHVALRHVDCPLLIVHCRDDAEIGLMQAYRWAAGKKGASLHVTEGLGHRSIVHAPEVTRKVADFILEGQMPVAPDRPKSLFARFTEALRRKLRWPRPSSADQGNMGPPAPQV